MLRRQSLTMPDPSMEHEGEFGHGTLERENNDGLASSRVGVISVNRARRWDNAPLTEEKTDLVSGNNRVDVHARSGNDSGQHEEEDDLAGDEFDCVGMGEVAQPMSGTTKAILIGGVALLVLALTKR